MLIRPRVRRLIQWSFVAIFIIVAPYLIITVMGYVIDINHWRLVKAGSIYLQFEPRDAEVSINGIPYPKRGSFVNHDIYISGLAPDTYTVTLSKKGLTPWQKNLIVTSGLVARATNIVLWPTPITLSASSTRVTEFSPTLSGFIKKNNNQLSIRNIPLKGTEVLTSHANSPYIITRVGVHYYFIDINTPTSTIAVDTIFSSLQRTALHATSTQPLRAILPYPFNNTKLIIVGNASIFLLDVKRNTLEILMDTKGIVAYTVQENELFVIDTDGSLFATHLMLRTTAEYFSHLSFATRIVASNNGAYILIEDEHHTLFLFDRATEALTTLTTKVAYYSFSSDSTRVVYITDNHILTTYYLVDFEDAEFHAIHTTRSITLAPQSNARTFSWIPSAPGYFLMQRGETLMLEEFDTRTPHNAIPIAQNVRSFVFDSQLYILDTRGTLSYGSFPQ